MINSKFDKKLIKFIENAMNEINKKDVSCSVNISNTKILSKIPDFFFKTSEWIITLKVLWKGKKLLNIWRNTVYFNQIFIGQKKEIPAIFSILWCNTMIPWILSFDRITSERITCRKLIQKSFFFLSTLSRIGKK